MAFLAPSLFLFRSSVGNVAGRGLVFSIRFGLSYRGRSPILFVSYLWFLLGGIIVVFEWGIGDSLACFGWALGYLGVRLAVTARSSGRDLGWSGWRLAAVSALFVESTQYCARS